MGMYTEIIDRLLSFPQRGEVKVDFDLTKKVFSLSVPIFSARSLPESVKQFIEARQGSTFKPHATSFHAEGNQVVLVQHIPFSFDFQDTLRTHVDAFWQMSRQCHRMLAEIAVEEKYGSAFKLDPM